MAAKAGTATTQPATGIMALLKSPDIHFAFGLIGILLIMIVPLPPLILDVLLCVSITSAFMVLLISIYVKEPLDFSTFPTILLITTLLRLGLNVATTRSILLDGATGNVSEVVAAFGNFVVGGNYFVGFVIFVILVVINFIVITKGAGRVAEVGARFTLDAMPGKQMSIDAELNAGLIDRDEARARRSKVEREADFYGAMDGASKFVRGDAIAGIIITSINIIVGLILGVVTYGMSFAEAAEVFTLLTVGDGLVSQVPALIISTAAGIVVTRAGESRGLSEAVTDQFFLHPKPIFVCAGLLAMMAIIPGLPMAPFSILAIGFVVLGRFSHAALRKRAEEKASKAAVVEKTSGGQSRSYRHHAPSRYAFP
jgi:flagellar biosynthesis protein FlhA